MATNGRIVTVFGGAGFLGRRIVRHLRDREFPVRIASRHPDRGHSQLGRNDPHVCTENLIRVDAVMESRKLTE
jgi:uncharacterized protein YbjT (DUF2867 family)